MAVFRDFAWETVLERRQARGVSLCSPPHSRSAQRMEGQISLQAMFKRAALLREVDAGKID